MGTVGYLIQESDGFNASKINIQCLKLVDLNCELKEVRKPEQLTRNPDGSLRWKSAKAVIGIFETS